jgi:hypothetical protein
VICESSLASPLTSHAQQTIGKDKPAGDYNQGQVIDLHQHQREAVEIARGGASYVITTGTGSGKSLGYIVPIVDAVLRQRAEGSYQPGVKAIIVYPMNALANSQQHELTKFLKHGYPEDAEPAWRGAASNLCSVAPLPVTGER